MEPKVLWACVQGYKCIFDKEDDVRSAAEKVLQRPVEEDGSRYRSGERAASEDDSEPSDLPELLCKCAGIPPSAMKVDYGESTSTSK